MHRFWKILVVLLAVLTICLGSLFLMGRREQSQTVAEIEPSAFQDTVPAILPEQTQPELAQYRAVTAAMYGPYQLPIDVYYDSRWETGGQVWGTLEDLVFLYQKEG